MEQGSRGRRLAAAALVIAGVLALYRPLLWGRALMVRDLSLWVVPSRWLLRESLRHGAPPAWNPWEGIGFPVAADPLITAFYPPAVVTLALPLAWGTSLLLVAHVLLGALGSYALARRLGALPFAAAVGGLAWGLAGLVGSEIPAGARLFPAAWIPLACLAAHHLGAAARASRPWLLPALALGACGAMMILTGEVFVTLMGAIPIAALLAVGAVEPVEGEASASPRAAVGRVALGVGAAAVLALLASAPSWLPAVTLVASTPRGHAYDASALNLWSLHPLQLVDLVGPRATLDAAIRTGHPSLMRLIGRDIFYATVYAGASVVALAVVSLRRRGALAARVAVGVAVLGALMALGGYTPVLGVMRAALRPFAYMRSPMKFLLVAQPMIALAAALGADRVLRERVGLARLAGFAAALAVVAAASWVCVERAVAVPMVTGCVGGALRVGVLALAVAAVKRWGARAAVALPLVVALDLGAVSETILTWEPPSRSAGEPALAAVVRREATTSQRGPAPPRMFRSERVTEVVPGQVLRDPTLRNRETLRPKHNVPAGIGVLNGYDAAMPDAVDRLARSGRVAALRLLSTDLALITGDRAPPGTHAVGAPVAGTHLYAVDDPLPRAFVAHAASEDVPARLSHLLDEEVLIGARVVLAARDLPRVPSRAPTPRSPCAITRWAPGDVTLRCDARLPGIAVLVEQHAPGWSATVDGRAAEVVAVNRVALGVPVREGAHEVRLTYATPALGAGVALGALGLLAGVAAGLWGLRRRLTREEGGA
ncbi:MAG: YfhO family protein [Polyangiales bacterium]